MSLFLLTWCNCHLFMFCLSEHEDECCVMIELLSEDAKASGVGKDILENFLPKARLCVSKGSKVNKYMVLRKINFSLICCCMKMSAS